MLEESPGSYLCWPCVLLLVVAQALLCSAQAYGQSPTRVDTADAPVPLESTEVDFEEPGEAVRVYLDCSGCDFTYIRRNIAFVNYVRDPQAAQVHVLVTTQGTGSGGRAFRLSFLGREQFRGQDHLLPYVSQPSDTDDARRKGFTHILRLGLLPYVAQTSTASQIEVEFDGAANPSGSTQPARDPWNNWVFRIGAGGSLEREQSQGETEFDGYVSADRVTEEWKIRSNFRVDYDRRSFTRQDQDITSTRHDLRAGVDVIKSLGNRWSAGLFSQAYSATFTNVAGAARLTPAIEYNVFPWDVSDRKVFTVAYTTGVRSFRYIEETIYGKMEETLPFHSLRSALRLTQPWGSFWAFLEGSHYLSDFDKRRAELNTNLSFRLTRGLSLELGTRAESIHDQLYLPKGDATLEEILLQRRRAATTYEFATNVGLRYTFGSIYNNIVNPRF